MTSAAAPARSRADRVLEHLAEHPGLTAGELGRVLGIPGQLHEVLHVLEARAQVVRATRWSPSQGRPVSLWRVAPPGTVSAPLPPADPEVARRRRERDRVSQQARRARARGLVIAPGGEPPSLRPVSAAAADLPGAACRTADPDLFFGHDDEDPADRQARERKALAICARCPARAGCYTRAAACGEKWGIWGGINFENSKKKGRQAS
jgi:WhiB family redox-sensing transcriptional regulator